MFCYVISTMTLFLNLDINAKIPIVRDEEALNGLIDHLPQNGLTNHNQNNNHAPQNNHIKPSFRRAENHNYCKRKNVAKKRTESYYHYEEPTDEELNSRVEYDMDMEDMVWLQNFNLKVGEELHFKVSESDFEKVIDRLEKESYFDHDNINQQVDPDAVCVICNDGDCSDSNVILFCDMCDLPVHQECYGVPYIPEGQWICRRCIQSPLVNVNCVLCPNMGGAFKQTEDNRWAHVICALWIPEVCFANTVFLEPIDINHIPSARWKLVCYICKQKRKGACIQCHKSNCYQSFHVTCAQQAGLYMKISSHVYTAPDGSQYTDVKKEAYCYSHHPGDKVAGGAMYSDNESSDDSSPEAHRIKEDKCKKIIAKTRKILAEKREVCMRKDMRIIVDDEKLLEISRQFGARGRRVPSRSDIESVRLEIVKHIHRYWQMKRENRSGVPLIRRLQVNNHNALRPIDRDNLDKDVYTRLRYDLEKCRILIGEVKKRELTKRRLFSLSMQIIETRLKLIDKEHPTDTD